MHDKHCDKIELRYFSPNSNFYYCTCRFRNELALSSCFTEQLLTPKQAAATRTKVPFQQDGPLSRTRLVLEAPADEEKEKG